jgi:hypothetical protein
MHTHIPHMHKHIHAHTHIPQALLILCVASCWKPLHLHLLSSKTRGCKRVCTRVCVWYVLCVCVCVHVYACVCMCVCVCGNLAKASKRPIRVLGGRYRSQRHDKRGLIWHWPSISVHRDTHTHTHTHTHKRTHTRTQTNKPHTRTHTRTHAHTHTHTRTCSHTHTQS